MYFTKNSANIFINCLYFKSNHLGNLKRHLRTCHVLEFKQVVLEEESFRSDSTDADTETPSSSTSFSDTPQTRKKVRNICQQNRKHIKLFIKFFAM